MRWFGLEADFCGENGYTWKEGGSAVYVVMNRIPVKEEYAEAFEGRFQERAGEVDGMPGFVRTLVLRPEGPDLPYVVFTMWESKEAFENWTRSDAFQKGHQRSGSLPREAFRGMNAIEAFSVFVDSDSRS